MLIQDDEPDESWSTQARSLSRFWVIHGSREIKFEKGTIEYQESMRPRNRWNEFFLILIGMFSFAFSLAGALAYIGYRHGEVKLDLVATFFALSAFLGGVHFFHSYRTAWVWRQIPLADVDPRRYSPELASACASLPPWVLTNRLFVVRYVRVTRKLFSGRIPWRIPKEHEWPKEEVLEVFRSGIRFYQDGDWNMVMLEGPNAFLE